MQNSLRQSFPAVLLLLGAAAAFGSPVGSVSGSVKDSTGAMMPGVKLTLINSATNA